MGSRSRRRQGMGDRGLPARVRAARALPARPRRTGDQDPAEADGRCAQERPRAREVRSDRRARGSACRDSHTVLTSPSVAKRPIAQSHFEQRGLWGTGAPLDCRDARRSIPRLRRQVGRGRDVGCPTPPAQIPACAFNALGSSLGFWRQSGHRARGAGCGVGAAIGQRPATCPSR